MAVLLVTPAKNISLTGRQMNPGTAKLMGTIRPMLWFLSAAIGNPIGSASTLYRSGTEQLGRDLARYPLVRSFFVVAPNPEREMAVVIALLPIGLALLNGSDILNGIVRAIFWLVIGLETYIFVSETATFRRLGARFNDWIRASEEDQYQLPMIGHYSPVDSNLIDWRLVPVPILSRHNSTSTDLTDSYQLDDHREQSTESQMELCSEFGALALSDSQSVETDFGVYRISSLLAPTELDSLLGNQLTRRGFAAEAPSHATNLLKIETEDSTVPIHRGRGATPGDKLSEANHVYRIAQLLAPTIIDLADVDTA